MTMVTYCSKHRSMLSLINRSIPRVVRVRVTVGGGDRYLHSCSRAMICRSRSPLSSPFSHPKSSSTSISMLSLLLLQCLYLEHGGHGGENDSAGTPRIPSRPSARVKLQQACFVIDVTRNISFRMPLLAELISIPLRKNQLFLSHSLVILSHDRPLSESERPNATSIGRRWCLPPLFPDVLLGGSMRIVGREGAPRSNYLLSLYRVLM